MLLAIDAATRRPSSVSSTAGRSSSSSGSGPNPAHTGDELAVLVRSLIDLETVEGACSARRCRSSSASTRLFVERWAGVELLVLGPGVATGMPIRYDDPREVGPDRIANAVAARERHGAPSVVVDFGTSTNFDVVSAAGEFAGGVLAPGVEISMDALFARAARLPKVPFVAPERVISQTTVVGAAVGARLRLRRSGRRDRRANPRRARAPAAPVIATGGLAELIAPHSLTITASIPS